MFGSATIEVAIGLIFIYFVLGVIVSHVIELLVGLFRWRSTLLEEGIRNLLADPTLANRVLEHPLLTQLTGRTGRRPSYIPSDLFAQAVFDALVPPEGTRSLAEIETSLSKLPDPAKRVIGSVLSNAQADIDA